jgi:hypothetical protein
MKLFRSKVWSVVDIGCLKWACIFLGMIVGAFQPEFIKRNVWLFAAAVLVLATKPAVSYFWNDQPEHEKE